MDYDEHRRRGEERLQAQLMAEGRRIREVYTYNTANGFVMYALCEDGTLWSRSPFADDGNTGWDAVPPIPGSFQAIEQAERQGRANEIAESLNGPYGRLHESDEVGKIEDTDAITDFDTTYQHPDVKY